LHRIPGRKLFTRGIFRPLPVEVTRSAVEQH
jgi:hypothetical protein